MWLRQCCSKWHHCHRDRRFAAAARGSGVAHRATSGLFARHRPVDRPAEPAVARLPVALALLAFNTFPVWTALWAWLIYREPPSRPLLMAMPVILVGLALALDVLGATSGLGAGAQWTRIGQRAGRPRRGARHAGSLAPSAEDAARTTSCCLNCLAASSIRAALSAGQSVPISRTGPCRCARARSIAQAMRAPRSLVATTGSFARSCWG